MRSGSSHSRRSHSARYYWRHLHTAYVYFMQSIEFLSTGIIHLFQLERYVIWQNDRVRSTAFAHWETFCSKRYEYIDKKPIAYIVPSAGRREERKKEIHNEHDFTAVTTKYQRTLRSIEQRQKVQRYERETVSVRERERS